MSGLRASITWAVWTEKSHNVLRHIFSYSFSLIYMSFLFQIEAKLTTYFAMDSLPNLIMSFSANLNIHQFYCINSLSVSPAFTFFVVFLSWITFIPMTCSVLQIEDFFFKTILYQKPPLKSSN